MIVHPLAIDRVCATPATDQAQLLEEQLPELCGAVRIDYHLAIMRSEPRVHLELLTQLCDSLREIARPLLLVRCID